MLKEHPINNSMTKETLEYDLTEASKSLINQEDKYVGILYQTTFFIFYLKLKIRKTIL